MSKVITFSRYYPSYHPKKGQKTFFAEKVMAAFAELPGYDGKIPDEFTDWDWYEYYNGSPKWHTIRAGKRFKVGDKFSPRIWTGKPYQSKQQILWSHDVVVKKTFDFKMDLNGVYSIDGYYLDNEQYPLLANNDGLTEDDLFHWFMPNYSKPIEFLGQIICWNPDIDYK